MNRPDGGDASSKKKRKIPEQDAALSGDLTNIKAYLLGFDNDDLSDLFGSPSLELEEPPATIWQYRATYCVVDIFLYPDGGTNRVNHVEVRGRQSDKIDKSTCFAAIKKDKPKSPDVAPPKASQ